MATAPPAGGPALPKPIAYNQSYSYDAIGNLTNRSGTALQYGANLNGTGAGPHQARRIAGQTATYDANGSLTAGNGRTIAWTTDNQPRTVTASGTTESYTYDATGQRLTKTRNGLTTLYLEGTWEETVNTSGVTQARKRYFTFAGQTIAVRDVEANQLTYIHSDHLGTVSVTTDAARTVTSRQFFDPWGAPQSGTVGATARAYTGQYLDATGLLFYNAR